MIVLQETATAQTFKVIPRSSNADTMIITSETTGVPTTYAITPTTDRYYLVIEKIVALKENNFYTLEVKDGSDTVYRGRIFCTNQAISTFTVNNNEFTSYSSDNEYITNE